MPQPGGKVRAAPFGEGEICAVAVSVLNLQSRETPRESWRRSCAMRKTKLWRWSRYHVIRNHVTCFPTNSDSHVSPQILVMFPSKFWSTCFPLKMCRWTEVQNREQSEVTANGRGWWVDVRVSKSLEPKLSQKRFNIKSSFSLSSRERETKQLDSFPEFLKSFWWKHLAETHLMEPLDGTIWNSGKTWSWTDGSPGWNCTNETGTYNSDQSRIKCCSSATSQSELERERERGREPERVPERETLKKDTKRAVSKWKWYICAASWLLSIGFRVHMNK